MKAAALVTFAIALSTFGHGPALATDTSTAIELCAKNPNCHMLASRGGFNIWTTDDNGNSIGEVSCPFDMEAECTLMTRRRGGPSTAWSVLVHGDGSYQRQDGDGGGSAGGSAGPRASGELIN